MTGEPTFERRLWLCVLHAGGSALVGKLSATAVHGLERRERPFVTIMVHHHVALDQLPGFKWARTRRNLDSLRRATNLRTTVADIAGDAQTLGEIDANRMREHFGLPKPKRQVKRRDAHCKTRYTDCE